MKAFAKMCSIALSAALILTLAACSKEEKGTEDVSSVPTYFDGVETHTIDASTVLDSVSKGEMDIQYQTENGTENASISLGISSSDFKAIVPEESLNRTEDEKYISLSTGMARVYFTNDDSPNGIVAIVHFGDVYGFAPTVSTKNNILTVFGSPEQEGELESEAVSGFLFGASGATFVQYSSGNNIIRFIFTPEGYLQATTLSRIGLFMY